MAHRRPYRKPTQVGAPKTEKAHEITPLKELGNLTPQLWNKGCLWAWQLHAAALWRSQITGPSDCLTKTQVSAKE